MTYQVKLFPRYLKNMGVIQGLIVYLQVEILNLSTIRIPSYANKINIRKHTSDKKVFREIFLFQIYKSIVSTPQVKVIIDGGSNIGLASVYFAHHFKDAIILAIEPEPTNIAVLKKNIFGYPKISLVPKALWPSNVPLKIKNGEESKWAFSVEESESTKANLIEGISMDRLMKDFSITKVDILKLDIESSEKELFSQNTDVWLPKVRTIIIELHDWMKPGCSNAVFTAVSKYPISVTAHDGMFRIKNTNLNDF